MAFSCVCRVLLILCVLIFIVMLTRDQDINLQLAKSSRDRPTLVLTDMSEVSAIETPPSLSRIAQS